VIKFFQLGVLLLVLATFFIFREAIGVEMKKRTVAAELSSPGYIEKILSSTGKYDLAATSAIWFNKEVPPPDTTLADRLAKVTETILGVTPEEKWIEINLSTQRLYAHEGNRIVLDFPVSSGLPWMPTVTGEFRIWAKIRAQRMTGGSKENGTFYDLPNVPYVQYFYKGYGVHGTYWHNDFGKPRSHGCVNISIPDAEKLYYWTEPALGANEYTRVNISPAVGTRVVVSGTTPTSLN
jgi:lipoprotein-anchoring transpeptidase ErfK/SrfK